MERTSRTGELLNRQQVRRVHLQSVRRALASLMCFNTRTLICTCCILIGRTLSPCLVNSATIFAKQDSAVPHNGKLHTKVSALLANAYLPKHNLSLEHVCCLISFFCLLIFILFWCSNTECLFAAVSVLSRPPLNLTLNRRVCEPYQVIQLVQ